MSTSINVAPSWGQWGNIFYNFARSGERKAVKTLHRDMARALSFAEALSAIWDDLPEELAAQAEGVFRVEMAKQGFAIGVQSETADMAGE